MKDSLKSDIKVICKNLAPLVGCRVDTIKWSPIVAKDIADSLNIVNRGTVSNVATTSYRNSLGEFSTFTANTSELGYVLYSKIKNYDLTILDSYFLGYASDRLAYNDTEQRLKVLLKRDITKYSNSIIYNCISRGTYLYLTELSQKIKVVLLNGYILRYLLMDSLEKESVSPIISESYLKEIEQSILYILENLNTLENVPITSTEYSIPVLCYSLLLLLKNVRQIYKYVLIEGDR